MDTRSATMKQCKHKQLFENQHIYKSRHDIEKVKACTHGNHKTLDMDGTRVDTVNLDSMCGTIIWILVFNVYAHMCILCTKFEE